MKNLFILTVLALTIMLNISLKSEEKTEIIEIKTSAVCEHCKENIEKALNAVEGVIKSNLDVETKIAKVEFNPDKTNSEKLRNAISKAGYHADDVKRDARAYKRLAKCCKND